MCDQCENMRVKILNKENQIEELKKHCQKVVDKTVEIHEEKDEFYRKRYKEIIEIYENENNEIDQFWAKRMNTLFDVAYGRIKDLEAELKHLKEQK